MKCKNVQKLLFAAKYDELDPTQRTSVEIHLVGCRECRAIRDGVMETDRTLEKFKSAVPRLRNEQAFENSIITSIFENENGIHRTIELSFIDRLCYAFSLRFARIACSAVITICITGYLFLEYRDMVHIVSLERRIGNETSLNQADVSVVREKVLRRLYDVYKLSSGDTPIAEITDELVLIKKNDLQMLLEESEILNRLPQAQLEQLSREFQSKRGGSFDTSRILRGMDAFKRDIQRLKNEFDQQSQHRGKQ
jgi:hypothetical protein